MFVVSPLVEVAFSGEVVVVVVVVVADRLPVVVKIRHRESLL